MPARFERCTNKKQITVYSHDMFGKVYTHNIENAEGFTETSVEVFISYTRGNGERDGYRFLKTCIDRIVMRWI